MMLIGLAVWAVLGLVYALATVAVGHAWSVVRRRRGREAPASRWLAALLVALFAGPSGCVALYLPHNFYDGDELVFTKPRLVDSMVLAYAGSFVAGFAAAYALGAPRRA